MRAATWLLLLVLLASLPARAELACGDCGARLVDTYYRMPEGRKLCPSCYDRRQPRCTSCGAKIVGSYLILEGARPVCRPCQEGYPACFVCALPVVRGGRRLADGRALCSEHARLAIMDPRQAREVLREAQQAVLATLGAGMRLRHPVDEVRLVDAAALARLMGHAGQGDSHVLGLFRARYVGEERHYTVFFASGLPRERLLTVAAHEYAHAWHSENHGQYARCSNEFREGFAEWVSYRVNQRLAREAELKHLLSQKAGDYIQGLQKFLELERRVGLREVLQAATSRSGL